MLGYMSVYGKKLTWSRRGSSDFFHYHISYRAYVFSFIILNQQKTHCFKPLPHESACFFLLTNRRSVHTKPVNPLTKTALFNFKSTPQSSLRPLAHYGQMFGFVFILANVVVNFWS